MPNKPIHLKASAPKNDRQAMWECIRKQGIEGKTFTAADIRNQLPGCPPISRVRDYLTCLTAAKYLEYKKQPRPGSTASYMLKRDTGIEAPRVRKDGTPVTQGLAREQMWRTMKVIGEFNAKELATNASTEACQVAINDAKDYVRHLHKAKYLHVTTKAKNSGGLARYRLLPTKNTGAKPPKVQKIKSVYDPNLGKVVWTQGGAS